MKIYKTVFFAFVVFIGVAYAAPIFKDGVVNHPSFEINQYRCYGFVEQDLLYGVAIADVSNKSSLYKSIQKEFVGSLASMCIVIPSLQDRFKQMHFPLCFFDEYVQYQITRRVVFTVDRVKQVDYFKSDEKVGCIYIVELSHFSLKETGTWNEFLWYLVEQAVIQIVERWVMYE